MFKKLKQKISEEQQQAAAQVPSSSPVPAGTRSRTSSLAEQSDDGTPNRELLAGILAEPAFLSEYTIFALDSSKQPKPQIDCVTASSCTTPKSVDGINGNETASQSGDMQSFAQKLQLRVPSMESLFRSPIKETLFRSSSKESLVRSSSRESLNRLDFDSSTFDPPSDVESEAEEALGNTDSLSKEQLFQRLRRMERGLNSYRGKYSELVTAYQSVQREKKKLQGLLSQSQDKALRRIGELREELQMDQQAKKHLQEEFDASLEEKDQYISVLQTQVSLLKHRLQSGQMTVELLKPALQEEKQQQPESLPKEANEENVQNDLDHGVSAEGDGDAAKTLETLQQRVKRQENLLQRCKEIIKSHKERATLLTNEKEALQEQLDERLQELEKMKELHMAEKTKLITQLRDAKNLIEQLEQDKGMVIAETKRQMHETLEMKEEEIAQLRGRIKQMTTQGEELREQKEKCEKAAFEELEKALSTAQKTEEARKKMKAEMDEQIKAIEKTSEEERINLQQELSRVKQEVVDILKKTSEEKIAHLQKMYADELVNKEKELNEKLQAREEEFQKRLKAALENNQTEYLKTTQEKEQQESLALEELELQKKALLLESENKLQDLQQEAETYRTRILELESSLEKCSQDSKNQAEEVAFQMESEKSKHRAEITVMVENHKAELESLQKQQEQLWTEKMQGLVQRHQTEIEKLREKYEQEQESLLKEKETVFRGHIEEMNEKTLEKLDVKQTELEALSLELAEGLKVRQNLEKELSVLKNETDLIKQEFEKKLDEQRIQHQQQVDSMIKEQKISVQNIEKIMKEEINELGLLLKEKERHLEEQQAQQQKLEESIKKAETELKQASDKMDIFQSHQNNSNEQVKAYERQLMELQQKWTEMKVEKERLEQHVLETDAHECQLNAQLDSSKTQVQDLRLQLEKHSHEMDQKLVSLTDRYESQLRDLSTEHEQTKHNLAERENEILHMKELQTQEVDNFRQRLLAKEESLKTVEKEYQSKLKNQEIKMEKIKQKAKEVQETCKKKLADQEAKLKKELENTQIEFSQKEKQFHEKMLEMAQASSSGMNDAISELKKNQEEQVENLLAAHQRELNETVSNWEKKVSEQAEELQEKHERELQEKEQEVAELKQELLAVQADKELASREATFLKEEGVKQGVLVVELQEQLKQKSAEIKTLTQNGTDMKGRLETLQADLSQSEKERASLHEQLLELKTLEENDKLKFLEVTEKLKATEEQLQALKSTCEGYEKEIEAKHLHFEKLSEKLAAELCMYCQEAEVLLQTKTSELIEKSSSKINAALSRISYCQLQTAKVKEVMLIQTLKIPELEAKLRHVTEQQDVLSSSLQQSVHQLEEKENQIKSMRADIEGLVTEKEALQKEGGHQQQAASEKESCITQLKKELAENMNAVTLMKEELQEKKVEIGNLHKLVSDLNTQLQNSISFTEKEEAVSLINKRHKDAQLELLNQIQALSSTVDTLNKEKASALEQVDHWMNKFSDWKKKAQSKFTQNNNAIRDLQMQLELKTRDVSEKDEQINSLRENLDQEKKSVESWKNELEESESKKEKREGDLLAELNVQSARIAELEEHISQKMTENICLTEELKRHCESEEKLQHARELGEEQVLQLQKQVDSMKSELEAQQREMELAITSSGKSKEDELKVLQERLEAENAARLAELKKKAEQKMAAIRKQLLSQMEEKEEQRRDAENQLREMTQQLQEREREVQRLHEQLGLMGGKVSEQAGEAMTLVASSREPSVHPAEGENDTEKTCQAKAQGLRTESELEEKVVVSHLQNELEEKSRSCHSLIAEEHGLGKNDGTGQQQDLENVTGMVDEAQMGQALEEEVKTSDASLASKLQEPRVGVELQTSSHKQLKASQKLEERGEPMEVVGEGGEGSMEVSMTQIQPLPGLQSQQDGLKSELEEAERDRQRLRKEINRLQRDLRTLRKEHQQELEITKKECEEEMEKRIKMEQEDSELKHNSKLKQLMREFNTQLAQKEQELEATIKETISKAQEVEAELLESHQAETSQLHKRIVDKEEDLKRTAKRYEEILDAREEEMTAKVTELQAQLEQLQNECKQGGHQEEGNPSSEKTQLAQKTTLVNDSKLKEQEFREQIHTLEDRLKKYEKNIYVTTVGTPYPGGNLCHADVSLFGEPTEFEYLRKVLFEYMMGRETKTMAKVITTVLKFPADQTQKILEREDARPMFASARSGIF
ncbi:golgin subfamily A member 4 isoform X3 [Monodelphis domestica]|uniref:golgin subfamily A member 4 isoform X3 n=1 Tax=Monodelphis domestica TaxID=13616 RepID=UPI0024E20797|nr:golgin subfamily A member 4 isoform X3 [Monodelphis domestica]